MSELSNEIDVLTIEEYAERLKVSRATVFEWMREGTLKAGRHYIKIGRVVRFPWSMLAVEKILEDSGQALAVAAPSPPRKKITPQRSGGKSQADLDF